MIEYLSIERLKKSDFDVIPRDNERLCRLSDPLRFEIKTFQKLPDIIMSEFVPVVPYGENQCDYIARTFIHGIVESFSVEWELIRISEKINAVRRVYVTTITVELGIVYNN